MNLDPTSRSLFDTLPVSEAVQLLVEQGIIAKQEGKNDEALEYFNQALAQNSFSISALCQRGILYLNMDRLDEAAKDLETVFKLDEAAKKDFEIVLLKEHGKRLALNALGETYRRQNRLEEAKEKFELVCTLNSENSYAYGRLGVINLAQGDRSMAMINFHQAIQLNPHDSFVRLQRIRLLMSKGSIVTARGAIQDSFDWISSDQDEFIALRGETYFLQKKFKEAKEDYELALAINPDNALAKTRLQTSELANLTD